MQNEAIGSTKHFHSLLKKIQTKVFPCFHREILHSHNPCGEKFLLSRGSFCEIVAKVKLVRIQSIRTVNVLIVDVHLKIGEK